MSRIFFSVKSRRSYQTSSSLQRPTLSLKRQSFRFFGSQLFLRARAADEHDSPEDCSAAASLAEYFKQALLHNGLDVAVLQNEPLTFLCSPHRDIHHGSGQVVGSNYLVGE
jgi:hypothetical protein